MNYSRFFPGFAVLVSGSVLVASTGCTLQPRQGATTNPPVYRYTEPTPVRVAATAQPVAAPVHQRTQLAALQQEITRREEDERRAQARIETLEHQTQELKRSLASVQANQPSDPAGSLREMDERLDRLEAQIRKVDEQRIKDKDEIVERLSALITAEVSRARPATPTRGSSRQPAVQRSEYFYEHTVDAGETLSAIAAAYGVTVQEIKVQNDLRDANRIRPGQILQIPASE